jgi:hypothetical protein
MAGGQSVLQRTSSESTRFGTKLIWAMLNLVHSEEVLLGTLHPTAIRLNLQLSDWYQSESSALGLPGPWSTFQITPIWPIFKLSD